MPVPKILSSEISPMNSSMSEEEYPAPTLNWPVDFSLMSTTTSIWSSVMVGLGVTADLLKKAKPLQFLG